MAKRYKLLGGPLDGQFGNFASFSDATYAYIPDPNGPFKWSQKRGEMLQPPGPFYDHRDEYRAFNRNGSGPRGSKAPTMVFLHESLFEDDAAVFSLPDGGAS